MAFNDYDPGVQMIKIGDFARLAGITIKTLRHYDQVGLLRPLWVDRYTGYRYYGLEQLPRLQRILALKEMGFSLQQVHGLLNSQLTPGQLQQIFTEKQQELQIQLRAGQNRLARVAERLREIEEAGRLPETEVTLKSVPALPYAAVALDWVDPAGVMAALHQARRRLNGWLADQRLPVSQQWLLNPLAGSSRYPELAVILSESAPPKLAGEKTKGVRLDFLPALPTAASLWQPFQAAPAVASYPALYAWARQHGYVTTGPLRELLVDDPAQSAWGYTEIQLPVIDRQAYKQQILNNLNRKEHEMEPTIITRPAFDVIGMRYFGKNENQEIKALWEAANPRMGEIPYKPGSDAYGICISIPSVTTGEFEYVAGLEVEPGAVVPLGMVARHIPASHYAVFTHFGPLNKLSETYKYIYHTWLPQSGYQVNGNLDFELYNEDFKDFSPDSRFYIYVPIKAAGE